LRKPQQRPYDGGRRLTMTIRRALILAAVLAVPLPASALTCYRVLDRNDNVVYQDTYPPIDLSERGQAQRDALRAKGEQLIAMESDRCQNIEFFTGSAGSTTLNVEQVVAGMPVRNMPGSRQPQPAAADDAAVPAAAATPPGAPAPTRKGK
jgi:hypothetical protein